ncbi:MAG: DUF1275 domain-containing protein [Pseudomonadota bacterium]|nr:DUF1275 domain-containing protein [Pseudomonadota bacterium]
MVLRYLYRLSAGRRSQRADRHLGYILAFVAGAVNAGGFLAIGQYTSHMTGIVSSMADHLALGGVAEALAALSAWIAFVTGASTTAILINLARRRRLRSEFALSLLVEAALLLLFALAGAHLADSHRLLEPVTVLLLCFIMGLQNAIITKVSGAVIRTTHLTGMSTDLGIEVGKLLYFNRREIPQLTVRANRDKLGLHARLIGSFFIGGVAGALGFKHIGYGVAIPLAALLALLAAGPILVDIHKRWKIHARTSARRRHLAGLP